VQGSQAKHADKTILGHPVGLFVLFFTEMWERFSYYGMRALLMLYMVKYLILDPEKSRAVLGFDWLNSLIQTAFGAQDVQGISSNLYGLYTGFVYLSPLFGGMLADRVFGQKKSVYIGAVLMAMGHFLMAFESFFLLALFCLVLGNGAFKPNISSQVGNLYAPGDARRDGAFTIFYMGINIGAFFSPLVCGTLGEVYGWHYGFGAAGVGMLIGLLVYHLGRNYIPNDFFTTSGQSKKSFNASSLLMIVGGFLASMVLFFLFLWASAGIKVGLTILILAIIAAWFFKLPQIEKAPVFALMILCLGTISFWIIFEQQGNTLQLWATDRTNWNIANFSIGNSIYQAFQSLNNGVSSIFKLEFLNVTAILVFIYTLFGSVSWTKKELALPNGAVDKKHEKHFKTILTLFVFGLGLVLLNICSGFTADISGESVLWSITLPSTWYQSFNPFFVFTFAPLLNIIWARSIARGNKSSSSVRKMGIGCFYCGIAFIFMIIAGKVLGTDPTVKGSIFWLAMTTWIFTMGELFLSPIGLSLVTKVAPARILSMMMGMWFLSSFFGNFLSGWAGSFYNSDPGGDNTAFFLVLCVLGCITGLLFIIAEKPLTKIVGNS